MPRVLWKGAISFGLIHVPVGLYSAEDRDDLDFTLLDRRDMAPVRYKRVNQDTGEEVTWDDIVKGYEYEDDRYVVLTDAELKAANPEATQTVDLIAFVNAADIPLLYYDTPYYLAPSKRGAKGYALLREVLQRAGKVGIAHVVIRTKQHLAALVPMGRMLLLNTLRYEDEIRTRDAFELPEEDLKQAGVSEKEIQMALALLDGMTEPWDPARYRDTFRDDVMAMIEKKIDAGETRVIVEPGQEEEAPAATNVVDFMALLKKSIEAKKGKAAPDASEEDKPARRAPGRRAPAKSGDKAPADKAATAKRKPAAKSGGDKASGRTTTRRRASA